MTRQRAVILVALLAILGAVIAGLPQPKRREVARPLIEAPATVGD